MLGEIFTGMRCIGISTAFFLFFQQCANYELYLDCCYAVLFFQPCAYYELYLDCCYSVLFFQQCAYYELYLDCCHAVWVALGQVLQGPVIAVQLSETTQCQDS
jgi:hypothetical protein